MSLLLWRQQKDLSSLIEEFEEANAIMAAKNYFQTTLKKREERIKMMKEIRSIQVDITCRVIVVKLAWTENFVSYFMSVGTFRNEESNTILVNIMER